MSLVEPILLPVNTVPSSKIRNAFICSPVPSCAMFSCRYTRKSALNSFLRIPMHKKGTLGVFFLPERPHSQIVKIILQLLQEFNRFFFSLLKELKISSYSIVINRLFARNRIPHSRTRILRLRTAECTARMWKITKNVHKINPLSYTK